MSDFKNSRYHGSQVDRARRESGWLPDEEFTRLGREEFRDYQQNRQDYQHESRQHSGIDIYDILSIVFELIKLTAVCGMIYVIIRTAGEILTETFDVFFGGVFWLLARIPWKAVVTVIVIGGLYRIIRRRI